MHSDQWMIKLFCFFLDIKKHAHTFALSWRNLKHEKFRHKIVLFGKRRDQSIGNREIESPKINHKIKHWEKDPKKEREREGDEKLERLHTPHK